MPQETITARLSQFEPIFFEIINKVAVSRPVVMRFQKAEDAHNFRARYYRLTHILKEDTGNPLQVKAYSIMVLLKEEELTFIDRSDSPYTRMALEALARAGENPDEFDPFNASKWEIGGDK